MEGRNGSRARQLLSPHFPSRNDKVCLVAMERVRFQANPELKGSFCGMGNEPARLALPKPHFKMP